MFDKNEEYKKPEFDTLEIEVYLTTGQSEIIRRYLGLIKGIGGVTYQGALWNDDRSTLTFLAPKLSEIVTALKGINIDSLEEWERKSIKNKITRTVNALEAKVSERWAVNKNYYDSSVRRLREYTEREPIPYTPVLVCGQYGFKWEAHQEGRNVYLSYVTIAPVPFISLDGTPTIEWVCDNEGFYLSLGSGNDKREKNENRFGTVETAIERGKAMIEGYIAMALEKEQKSRQEAIVKLAEIETDAFIKVQQIA